MSLESRIKKIYAQSAKELTDKVNSFFADFERMDKKKQALVASGKLSEKEYKRWRKNKLLMSEKYMDLRDTMADSMSHANEIATEYMNGELPKVYARNFNDVGREAERVVRGYSFDLTDQTTVRNLATQNRTLLPYRVHDGVRDVRWNTKRVNSAVLQGILQGESAKDLAKRLMKVTEMNRDSAIRNARTAVTGAQNKGRLDAMKRVKDDGVIVKKEWIATKDSRTRDAHWELHMRQVDPDEPFENAIGRIMYPGDPNAHPANTYNCRCTIAQVFVGFADQERR